MNAKKSLGIVVLVLVAALVAGCSLLPGGAASEDGPTPEPTVGGTIEGTANVETVDLLIMESFPVQVRAEVSGYLPDGCTELGNWTVERNGSTFSVLLPTERPADAVCTEALESFQVSIPLEVLGLEAGTYTVDVNGVTETFELAVDNIPQQEPEVEINLCEALRNPGEAVFTWVCT